MTSASVFPASIAIFSHLSLFQPLEFQNITFSLLFDPILSVPGSQIGSFLMWQDFLFFDAASTFIEESSRLSGLVLTGVMLTSVKSSVRVSNVSVLLIILALDGWDRSPFLGSAPRDKGGHERSRLFPAGGSLSDTSSREMISAGVNPPIIGVSDSGSLSWSPISAMILSRIESKAVSKSASTPPFLT